MCFSDFLSHMTYWYLACWFQLFFPVASSLQPNNITCLLSRYGKRDDGNDPVQLKTYTRDLGQRVRPSPACLSIDELNEREKRSRSMLDVAGCWS